MTYDEIKTVKKTQQRQNEKIDCFKHQNEYYQIEKSIDCEHLTDSYITIQTNRIKLMWHKTKNCRFRAQNYITKVKQ